MRKTESSKSTKSPQVRDGSRFVSVGSSTETDDDAPFAAVPRAAASGEPGLVGPRFGPSSERGEVRTPSSDDGDDGGDAEYAEYASCFFFASRYA